MRSIRIGLLGCGTVGSGVLTILSRNRDLLAKRIGAHLDVVRVAIRDLHKQRAVALPESMLTSDVLSVATADDVDIVCELMGGVDASREAVLAALRAGKHVVTANKALLAKHGPELFAVAAEEKRQLVYEASVGASIPIIRTLQESFVAENMSGLYGIINGTTNFILSAMTDRGDEFSKVLEEAQRLGYAEADPTFDIEGVDSIQKMAILATLTYGAHVNYEEALCEGITGITADDIGFAERFGYKIKLVALARMEGERLDLRAHPVMLPATAQLAQVHGVFNALYLDGDNVGPALLYGQGAGSLPTASAVIGDIAAVARDIAADARIPDTRYTIDDVSKIELLPADDIVSAYYVRLAVPDRPGILGQAATIIGRHGISLASVLQEEQEDETSVPIVIMTHAAREGNLRQALRAIEEEECSLGPATFIRIIHNLA